MAHKKGASSSRNGRDSAAQRLGVKRDGGNGGHGGDVRLVVDPGVHTLLDFHFHPHVRAGNGKGGQGGNRDGANGGDLVLRVPDGTVVHSADGEVLADLVGTGTSFAVAPGGRGGGGEPAAGQPPPQGPRLAPPGGARGPPPGGLGIKSGPHPRLGGVPRAGKGSPFPRRSP